MPAMLAAEEIVAAPPWWVTILLGVLALAGTIGAAYLSRQKPAPEAPRTDRALDLIEATMRDLRAERDEAQDEVRRLRKRIDSLEDRLSRGGTDDQ